MMDDEQLIPHDEICWCMRNSINCYLTIFLKLDWIGPNNLIDLIVAHHTIQSESMLKIVL